MSVRKWADIKAQPETGDLPVLIDEIEQLHAVLARVVNTANWGPGGAAIINTAVCADFAPTGNDFPPAVANAALLASKFRLGILGWR